MPSWARSEAPPAATLVAVTTFPLRSLKLRPGEERRIELDVVIEPFHLGGSAYPADSPVAATFVVQRAVSGDVYRLQLETTLRGPCMRCLAPAAVAVEIDARDYEAEDGNAPAELHTEYVRDGDLDLSAWARDQVAFALPEQILCRPDCAGLCPVCGRDLNVEPHTHEDDSVDSRWAALEALRGPAASGGG